LEILKSYPKVNKLLQICKIKVLGNDNLGNPILIEQSFFDTTIFPLGHRKNEGAMSLGLEHLAMGHPKMEFFPIAHHNCHRGI
jgi:hypothetical protein